MQMAAVTALSVGDNCKAIVQKVDPFNGYTPKPQNLISSEFYAYNQAQLRSERSEEFEARGHLRGHRGREMVQRNI